MSALFIRDGDFVYNLYNLYALIIGELLSDLFITWFVWFSRFSLICLLSVAFIIGVFVYHWSIFNSRVRVLFVFYVEFFISFANDAKWEHLRQKNRGFAKECGFFRCFSVQSHCTSLSFLESMYRNAANGPHVSRKYANCPWRHGRHDKGVL